MRTLTCFSLESLASEVNDPYDAPFASRMILRDGDGHVATVVTSAVAAAVTNDTMGNKVEENIAGSTVSPALSSDVGARQCAVPAPHPGGCQNTLYRQ